MSTDAKPTAREILGHGVAALRTELGLTQAELAGLVGVTAQFIAAVEQGRKAPSFDNLDKLANALGCEVHSLFALRVAEPRRDFRAALVRALSSVPATHEVHVLELARAVARIAGPRSDS